VDEERKERLINGTLALRLMVSKSGSMGCALLYLNISGLHRLATLSLVSAYVDVWVYHNLDMDRLNGLCVLLSRLHL
jgi:hypothetical protein